MVIISQPFMALRGRYHFISCMYKYLLCVFLNDDGRVWNDLAMTHSDSFFILE